MDKIRYSIIIPHKNIPDLLQRCVDSIPKRDDIQVVIVDDGSDENIINNDNYPGIDRANVEFYHIEDRKGAGRARNCGLQHAKGDWLIFSDADDLFVEDAFDLCDKYYDSSYDIVYFGIDSINSLTGERVDRYIVYNKYVVSCDNQTENKMNQLRFRHDVPWGKMIRHSIVTGNGIRFGETKYCNDTLFSTRTALKANRIYADVSPFYCVTERDGSLITHSSLEAYTIRYEVILTKNKLLRENGYAQYQLPVASYLKQISHYGVLELIKAIILGVKYHANFFIGVGDSLKKRLMV